MDFTSDTVTIPSPEMLASMITAKVGDNVYNNDPTVIHLQELISLKTNKPASLFVASCTMANQLAILSLVSAPCSILCNSSSHVFKYEGGGASFLSRATLIPINAASTLTPLLISKHLITSNDIHCPQTQLIIIEIPLNGVVIPLQDVIDIHNIAKSKNIKMHLDGARLWNASISTNIPISEYCKYFDTISLCFSKGLGCPLGAILSCTKQVYNSALRFRKVLGGGWRQAGYLAQAAIYALDNHYPKLVNDHDNAKFVESELIRLGFTVTRSVDTNMVWFDATGLNVDELMAFLEKRGLVVSLNCDGDSRLVFHHQVDYNSCLVLIKGIQEFLLSESSV